MNLVIDHHYRWFTRLHYFLVCSPARILLLDSFCQADDCNISNLGQSRRESNTTFKWPALSLLLVLLQIILEFPLPALRLA